MGPNSPRRAATTDEEAVALRICWKDFVRMHATVAGMPAEAPPQSSFSVALNQYAVLFGGGGLVKEVAVPDSVMKALTIGSLVQA